MNCERVSIKKVRSGLTAERSKYKNWAFRCKDRKGWSPNPCEHLSKPIRSIMLG